MFVAKDCNENGASVLLLCLAKVMLPEAMATRTAISCHEVEPTGVQENCKNAEVSKDVSVPSAGYKTEWSTLSSCRVKCCGSSTV